MQGMEVRANPALSTGCYRCPCSHAHGLLQGRLGGGEGVQGIYGSITQQGMQRVLDCLHHSCGLGPSSTLVDIGAGLGR
jgi:hypothetical protein